ncbi:type I secretion system permease/ATPase [Bradyrhizobium cajani]|uniref:Type I secretion system permease/ATPase n=1 Tax=Bradyrhizobium cajani TaxID=1928661 RepID=A0A844T7R5_9BRAD|nr:type I secretion system permease/ATPase [Bradyrhizobium cajani]MCP3370684.1 type I secretion system permease/ATPase [Bradyrhizobium cajani]MVT75163.1 type I secretion system permease/ATPase [Bradyrhizobium cajani]
MLLSSKATPPQAMPAAVVAPLRRAAAGLALVSGAINILMLTAPLFMLQVYDRVLASRSIPTLVGLACLALGLYVFQAFLDVIRARILLRVGERIDRQISARVHEAIIRLPLETRAVGDGLQPLRDLDSVRNFLGTQAPTALFDLPWMPLYLAICFLFHVWIGVTALSGALILMSLTVATEQLTRASLRDTTRQGMDRNARMDASRRNAEVVRAMGMNDALLARWSIVNGAYLTSNRRTGDVVGAFSANSRAIRQILQSAILGVGAYLVIGQEVTAGVMVASSIMMGRALAPVDLAIAGWKPFLAARQSWLRLTDLLALVPPPASVLALPRPARNLTAEALTIVPPGRKSPTVSGVSLSLSAGSALGVIGPSGSGKSTLIRALVGVWTPIGGKIRLDGASLDQWDRRALGTHTGYLPQGVDLFEGTISENIARFNDNPDPAAVVAAAKAAGAHDLITQFEKGYQTNVGEGGSVLSAGQRQRIGLARALYGDPFLVVLDEPNANLDADGERAVIQAIAAIRARGGIAIVVAHRPSALGAVDYVLMMEAGRCKAFGPRDAVLSRVLRNGSARTAMAADGEQRSGALMPLRVVAGSTETLERPDGGDDVER